jgi:hypothetical protein
MTKSRADNAYGRAADLIVTSKLLVLQSKRMLLTSAHGRHDRYGHEKTRIDVERLEHEVKHAHDRYTDAVLRWASPRTPQYQLVAYTSLIAKGERLLASLRRASEQLSPDDRGATMKEMRELEAIIAGWRSIARESMSAAVA